MLVNPDLYALLATALFSVVLGWFLRSVPVNWEKLVPKPVWVFWLLVLVGLYVLIMIGVGMRT